MLKLNDLSTVDDWNVVDDAYGNVLLWSLCVCRWLRRWEKYARVLIVHCMS